MVNFWQVPKVKKGATFLLVFAFFQVLLIAYLFDFKLSFFGEGRGLDNSNDGSIYRNALCSINRKASEGSSDDLIETVSRKEFGFSWNEEFHESLLAEFKTRVSLSNQQACESDQYMIIFQKMNQADVNLLQSLFPDWCVMKAVCEENSEFLLRALLFAFQSDAKRIWIVKNATSSEFAAMESLWKSEISEKSWLEANLQTNAQDIPILPATIPLSTVSLIQFLKTPLAQSSAERPFYAKSLSSWSSEGQESSVMYLDSGFFLILQEFMEPEYYYVASNLFAIAVREETRFRAVSISLNSLDSLKNSKKPRTFLHEELKPIKVSMLSLVQKFDKAVEIAHSSKYLDKKSFAMSKIWSSLYQEFEFSMILDEFSSLDTCGKSSKHLQKLELFLPIGRGFNDFQRLFLPSFQLFWPKPLGNVVIMMDEDRSDKIDAPANLAKEHSSWISYVSWNSPSTRDYWNGHGYDRQQYLMFYADKYTSAEYVGFVDDDSVFVTKILDSDLFDENGNPVVNGVAGDFETYPWQRRSRGTVFAMQKKEAMRCMTYFPVIIRREDLPSLRDYVSEVHSELNGRHISFDEVFKNISTTQEYYSQFNLMCTYLWYFRNDRYSWKLQKATIISGVADNSNALEIFKDERFRPEMAVPKQRVAMHYSYQFQGRAWDITEVFRTAPCYATGQLHSTIQPDAVDPDLFGPSLRYCLTEANTTEPFELEWRFETQNWMWDARVKDEHVKRMSKLRQCSQR